MQTLQKPSHTGKITNSENRKPWSEYNDYLYEELKDPEYAGGYLAACLNEGEEVFMIGTRNVLDTQERYGDQSQSSKLNRDWLRAQLENEGNLRLSDLNCILDRLGYKIEFSPKS